MGDRIDKTNSGKPVVHGRASSYNNHKCRCPECTDAWAVYMKPRIKKHRAGKKKAPGTQINL